MACVRVLFGFYYWWRLLMSVDVDVYVEREREIYRKWSYVSISNNLCMHFIRTHFYTLTHMNEQQQKHHFETTTLTHQIVVCRVYGFELDFLTVSVAFYISLEMIARAIGWWSSGLNPCNFVGILEHFYWSSKKFYSIFIKLIVFFRKIGK